MVVTTRFACYQVSVHDLQAQVACERTSSHQSEWLNSGELTHTQTIICNICNNAYPGPTVHLMTVFAQQYTPRCLHIYNVYIFTNVYIYSSVYVLQLHVLF